MVCSKAGSVSQAVTRARPVFWKHRKWRSPMLPEPMTRMESMRINEPDSPARQPVTAGKLKARLGREIRAVGFICIHAYFQTADKSVNTDVAQGWVSDRRIGSFRPNLAGLEKNG